MLLSFHSRPAPPWHRVPGHGVWARPQCWGGVGAATGPQVLLITSSHLGWAKATEGAGGHPDLGQASGEDLSPPSGQVEGPCLSFVGYI